MQDEEKIEAAAGAEQPAQAAPPTAVESAAAPS